MEAKTSLFDQICREPRRIAADGGCHDGVSFLSLEKLLHLTANATTSDDARRQLQACSALCALIKSCLGTGNATSLVCSHEVADYVLKVCISYSARLKTNNLRRLYMSLHMICVQSRLKDSSLVDHVQRTLVLAICPSQPHASIKPGLQASQFLLKRGVLTPEAFARSLIRAERALNTAVDETRVTEDGEDEQISVLFTKFTGSLLRWIPLPSLAQASGSLLNVFFQSLADISYANRDDLDPQALCAWIPALHSALQSESGSLESFKHHVFPGLFALNRADTEKFLNSIGLPLFLAGLPVAEDRFQILCAALEISKQLGLVRESSDIIISNTHHGEKLAELSQIVVPVSSIAIYLGHESPIIRISSLALLIYSPTTTQPFSENTLKTLINVIPLFLNEVDAKIRQELLGQLLRMQNRIRESCFLISHQKSGVEHVDKTTQTNDQHAPSSKAGVLKSHKSFLHQYLSIISKGINPCSTYQTLWFCLKAFDAMVQSRIGFSSSPKRNGKADPQQRDWPFKLDLFKNSPTTQTEAIPSTSVPNDLTNLSHSKVFRNLLDLLSNPYEDIRSLAADLLSHQLPFESDSSQLIQVAERRMAALAVSSGRADICDGLGHLYNIKERLNFSMVEESYTLSTNENIATVLLDRLKQKIELTNPSIPIAQFGHQTSSHALIGGQLLAELIGLRYVLQTLHGDSSFQFKIPSADSGECIDKVMICCKQIWHIVKPILCHDSPEGIILAQDETNGIKQDPKAFLSFCWRSLKESSLLLRAVIDRLPQFSMHQSSLDEQTVLSTAGSLCFDQLSNLRHRGAVTTVTSTFENICKVCGSSKSPRIQKLLLVWYDDTFKCIEARSSTTTRRSAGIPTLLVGILSSNSSGDLLSRAVKDLEGIILRPETSNGTEQSIYSDLPQVHAMNCLKLIMTSSHLPASPFISKILHISATAIASILWPIRNCGLMLFKTVVDQLFGTNYSQDHLSSAKSGDLQIILHDQFPGIVSLLSEILRENAKSQDINQEAVLLALEIILHCGSSIINEVKVKEQIKVYLASPQWHVRTLASKSMCAVLKEANWMQEVEQHILNLRLPQNNLHGGLLFTLEALRRFSSGQSRNDCSDSLWNALLSKVDSLLLLNRCPVTQSLFLDVVSYLFWYGMKSSFKLHTAIPLLQERALVKSMPLEQLRSNTGSASIVSDFSLLRRSLGQYSCLLALSQRSLSEFQENLRWLHTIGDVDSIDHILKFCANELLVFPAQHQSLTYFWFEVVVLLSEFEWKSVQIRQTVVGWLPQFLRPFEMLDALPAMSDQLRLGRLSNMPDQRSALPLTLHNASLELGGYALATDLLAGEKRLTSALANIGLWIHTIKLASNSHNDFDTRFAGFYSLRAVLSHYTSFPLEIHTGHLLPALFVLYSYLNDDSLEIRRCAVSLASICMSKTDIIKTPPTMTTDFLDWLILNFGHHPKLITYGVSRLLYPQSTYESVECNLDTLPDFLANVKAVQDQYQKAVGQFADAASILFAEEKQNLYLEPMLEIERWSFVIESIPEKYVDASLKAFLRDWFTKGTETLIEICLQEKDGPFGWTSNPEVFELGIRMMSAAKVSLMWEEAPESKTQSLELLQQFVAVMNKQSVHHFWIERAEDALEAGNVNLQTSSFQRL